MKKEYNQSVQQNHGHTEQIKIQYLKKKKLNVTIQQNNTKTINFDHMKKENIKGHNLYKILITRGSGYGKSIGLRNLIKQ